MPSGIWYYTPAQLAEINARFANRNNPEPSADGRRARGARPLFVVQLHHASHRHYDFRLQVGDTLKSWAVPKGPSLDPAVKRLAAEVEDHPIDYADFEGDIPKGQYGGGHVATFDRGVWTTDGDAEAQLAKGHLRFRLFGDKLKGGWHLVRTQTPSRRPQWLLFKERDDHAGTHEADDLLQDVVPPSGATSSRVAGRARKRVASVAKASHRWAKRAARAASSRDRVAGDSLMPLKRRRVRSPLASRSSTSRT